ncbi:MAG: FMN-dependent NADH-azoreductase [Nevskiaceae bacterium]|nr:MAG: FMN-dependent NADH-azoreductase [Nevskiaceae bacterium]
MKTLLQINTSLNAGSGQSSLLADSFVAAWKASHPGAAIKTRNLATDEVPHLTAERFQAFITKPEERNPAQQAIAAYSDALIDELKSADVIVLGLPMYNFSIPSQLKAYFDHIARAGITFQYTPNGPVGLVQNKKVYVFATRGGFYAGTPADTETQYVRDFLKFIGITDVEFVYAEGLAYGEDSKTANLVKANDAIGRLAANEQLAA